MRVSAQVKRDPEPIKAPAFRLMQAEGSLTRAEADQEIQIAVQKAKLEATRETEQKLKVPILSTMENLNNILDELSSFRRELFKECETELIELLHILSRKILAAELTIKPELLHQLVEKAIEAAHKEKEIEVWMNPQDLQSFKSMRPDIFEKFKDQIRFQTDSEISVGTAKVQTKTKSIDVNISQIVDDLLQHVIEERVEVKETGDEGDKV